MRLFIAATFPAEILRDLNDRVAAVKSKLPHASWVRPESQHLTFAFLGEQPESVVDAIRIDAGDSFEARLHGCGFFPNRRNARVGWVGVEPADRFIELAARVRENLTDFDRKEFKPHLTLMRIRDRWPPLAIETFENALRDYKSAPFVVSGVTLYSSKLQSSGAVHTPLRRWG